MTTFAWVVFGLALATVLDPAGRAWVARGWWATVDELRDDAGLPPIADASPFAEVDAKAAAERKRLAELRSVARRPDPPPSEGPRPAPGVPARPFMRRPAPNQAKPFTWRA